MTVTTILHQADVEAVINAKLIAIEAGDTVFGTVVTLDTGTAAGEVPTNADLGSVAFLDVGVTTGSIAAGDDARFPSGALGDSALLDVGVTTGTVAAGDDARIVAGGTSLQSDDVPDLAEPMSPITDLAITSVDVGTLNLDVGSFVAGTYFWVAVSTDGYGRQTEVSNEVTATINDNDVVTLGFTRPSDVSLYAVRIYRGTETGVWPILVGGAIAGSSQEDPGGSENTYLDRGEFRTPDVGPIASVPTPITTTGYFTDMLNQVSQLLVAIIGMIPTVGTTAGTVAAGDDARFTGVWGPWTSGFSESAANLAAVANAINTTDKTIGKMVWDTTNHIPLFAGGVAAGDHWYTLAGVDTITPA